MRDRWEETNGFAQAIKVVNQLVAGGAQLPNTQKLTLIRLSQPEQPFFVERNVNEDFVMELSSKLDPQSFKCTHQALDLATGDHARLVQPFAVTHGDRRTRGCLHGQLRVTVEVLAHIDDEHAGLGLGDGRGRDGAGDGHRWAFQEGDTSKQYRQCRCCSTTMPRRCLPYRKPSEHTLRLVRLRLRHHYVLVGKEDRR